VFILFLQIHLATSKYSKQMATTSRHLRQEIIRNTLETMPQSFTNASSTGSGSFEKEPQVIEVPNGSDADEKSSSSINQLTGPLIAGVIAITLVGSVIAFKNHYKVTR
jgi:hypothetical protein